MQLTIQRGDLGPGFGSYQTRPVVVNAQQFEYDFNVAVEDGFVKGQAGDFLVEFPDATLAVYSAEEFERRFARKLGPRKVVTAEQAIDAAAAEAGVVKPALKSVAPAADDPAYD